MPSSTTTSLRVEQQADGENINLWGDKLNTAEQRFDEAIAGWATIALTGNLTLTTSNFSGDQAHVAMLRFTGTGPFTVTVPAVSKRYDIENACTGVLTITNGSSSTTLQPGEVVSVITDGATNFARVQPTDFGGQRITSVGAGVNAGDAVNVGQMNAAVTSAAYSAGTFGVAIAPGNAGQILTNNGATPNWETPTVGILTDYASDQATRAAQLQAFAVCWALLF